MRHHARLGTLLLAVASLVACARNPEPRAGTDSAPADSGARSGDAASPSQEVELRGRVVNSGTDRFTFTTLDVQGAPATRLTGTLRDELRTLSGAEVMVRGAIDSSGPGRALEVREYEVLSIGGKRPHVGRVLLRGDELWLAASDTLRLIPALDALRERVGAKIWVVGTSEAGGTELRIESYGVIVPAS